MPLAGVILAAGRSARMGTPKALLDFRGAPFIVRILEAFEALDLKTRVVVLGPDAARIRPVRQVGRAAPHEAPAFGGRRGHPVIWDAALFGALESSPATRT